MIGYYLFVCMIYVVVIFLVYMGLLTLRYCRYYTTVAYDICVMISVGR